MSQSHIPTILLVEDSEVVRKSASRCLRRSGFVVLEVASAGEALAVLLANGEKIDLMLTDLVLPAMGGIRLACEARRLLPNLVIAYMTGHLGRSARSEIELDNAVPVLIKPFTPSILEERVREALALAGRANG